MRIFVMFGTQDKRFDRLLNAILNSHFVEENDVYVQLGYTKGNYEKIHGQEYYTEEELNRQIEIADLIITHAGVGAIVAALKLKKRVIVVPRLGKYKEQNNDHQVQIMERYDKLGYIIPCTDLDDLDKLKEEIASSYIFTNATGMGMKPLEGQTYIPDKSFLRKDLIVTDVVYAPAETALLKMAKEVGCKTLNGFPMMLFQGAAAFKLWTNQDMPIEHVKEVMGIQY